MVIRKLDLDSLVSIVFGGLCCLLMISFSSMLQAENMASVIRTLPAWTAKEIAVIINDSDPLSGQIAQYYQTKRNIPPEQIIHVRFKSGIQSLSEGEFKAIKQQVDKQTPAYVQGYVLTWLLPWVLTSLFVQVDVRKRATIPTLIPSVHGLIMISVGDQLWCWQPKTMLLQRSL